MRFGKVEIFICLMIVVVTCSTFFLHDRLIVDDSTRQHIHRLGHHINRLENRINRLVPVNPAPDEELSKNKTGHNTKVIMRRSHAVQKVLFDLQVPKIAVAIPTYNRIGYVHLTSSALKGTFPSKDTWIFDDKSTEYSEQDLMEWYGTEHVSQSKNRLKADAMARHILEWFLSTNYDVLVLLDSDLVVAPGWVAELKLGLSESKGLLSLYRSAAPLHKSVQCSDVLCLQPSMGNAGTVWRRALVQRMLSEMPARNGGFDWGWSEWCTKNKVAMEALKRSAVLHIGMYGSWSHESTAEKSFGFPMSELTADVRQRAEMFLKGGKPTALSVVSSSGLNPELSKHAVIPIIHINGGDRKIKCDVPCFWPPAGPILRTITIDEIGMTMLMSMEGEEIYPSLKLSNRKKNHAIASTRFDSDIPMPYYSWTWTQYMDEKPMGDAWSQNHIQTAHIPFHKVKKAAVFIARNCGSRSNREGLVKSLMELMPVDSVSRCLHNFDLEDTSEKIPMMQKYAMYFAFENQRVDDYITEKLWDTFQAGVLPVYFGAPNIKEHVPEHSIVHVDDFESHEELAQHLQEIMSNEELYNSYHAWRYKPLPHWFVAKYNFTHVHSECRVCRWASAKLRGLPWDAAKQQTATVAPVAAIACDEELEEYSLSKGCSTSAKHCLVETSIPCCQNIVFHTLEKIVAVLDNNNIKYSLMYGTLIAAARDQFLQPFDNRDVDIAIPSSQLSTLLRLLDLEPFRTGSVTSFRDEEYKKETRAIVGKYCVHNGEQGWDPSYQHNYSLFRHPPYVDVYSRPDAEFQEVSKLQLGTQSLPPKEWMVFQNWKSRLDSVYPKWQTRPDWISPAQYGYHGLPGDSEDILWVIPAFKRAWSLDLVLKSLTSQTKILVSKDADSAEIESVLKKYTAEVINHPYSCSQHPNRFPAKDESLNKDYKGDTYGNPRSPWATCLKHHWWWMMKQAWARKPERVCVLEDDTVIHPQAFEWLAKNKEGNVKLTSEEIAVPWCMSAKEWQALDPKAFCEHDDYNWDQTIAWMFEHAHKNKAVVPSKALSMHVGDCGGWDAGGRAAKCTPEKVSAIRRKVAQWKTKTAAVETKKGKWLTAHSKPNGGWGHPKDWAHCMEDQNTIMGPTDGNRQTTHTTQFENYGPWSGYVPQNMDEGHESLFLGVFTSCKSQGPWASTSCGNPSKNIIHSKYPQLGDHTFEWQDMISSILTSNKRFNMIELGAGWAKWIVDGTALAKKEGIQKIVAIGVEAQPIHCQWGQDHIATNKMEKEDFMICAAVGEKDGKVQFPVDDTGGQYGNGIQMLLDGKNAKKIIEIDEISLCSVIQDSRFQGELIDFLSLDVQSYEHAILKPTPKTLECLKRVRLIHISLHRVEENDARQFVETFVGLMGWKLVRYFPLETPSVSTQYGPVSFHDGVITFVNTHLSPELVDMLYNKDNIHMGSYTAHSFKSKSTALDWSDKNKITDIHYQQSLCELIPLICECNSKEQQDITLKNILSIFTLDQLHYFIRTMSRTDTNIHGHKLALFAPKDDIGLKTVISEQKKDEYRLRQWNLKPEDLFVDVGSNLGVVSILAALQYPDIRILSIEASPPTWFYQQLNLLCNIPSHQTVKSICVGLGKTDGTTKMMYRPSSTTSTRNWNPNSEYNPSEDIEFDIHISSLDTVLAETSNQYPITMMKLDCEGCEYEFLPSLSGQTKIKDMVGEIHYGFMAQFNKEPSAEKIMAAHNRVCSYSYFKDTAKECCYFDKSNDKLCNDYTTWAEKNRLALYQTDITTIKNIQTIIQTSDIFAAIDYNAPENKGPWKQGWDYDYDGRFKDGLTVHVVPHSHNDPGWIKTYHTYYSTQTKHILDTVIAALTEDPRRTFIWAEISYFSLWWDDATQQQKEQANKLVAEKRLDFVTGGWVMNDEASVTARATRWHLQEGRDWLKETFGITPQYSWAIDPFGHSAGQAQVLKEMGYKGMLIQRVHYAVKKQLAQKQQLEFQWQTPAGEIFTHMMPFYSYDGPHTCGPDPSICCQFDFARIGGGYSGCPWHKPSVPITDSNVAERSRTWLDQVYKKAMLYRGKHVLIPVGDDFRYQTMDEAHKQFTNYQKMFDWIGANIPAVKVSFSTLTRYFDAVRVPAAGLPRLEGSFFPYSDRKQDYWTGYFNSRIFYKGYDRLLESLIAAVESKCPVVDIHLQKRALGIFQHHDGITGTAKSAVVQDYYETMQKAVAELKSKLKICLDIAAHVIVNPLSVDTPTMKANEIRPYEQDKCVSVPAAGLQFENIKIDEHGRIVQINDTPVHESLVWRSNNPGQGVAGAYLMSVTSKEDILQPIKHTTCIAKKYKQVETTFDMLKRRIRVYNDGTIEFIYDVDIHARNNGELWAVYKPSWSAERLCSDVHGLTWECHTERKDAPLQAKFWPMPTMAWLASSTDRMTFTGAQPTGVGFHEGAMVLMLDRRGNQDDARGLGQGITDSRPVEMRFGVLMEGEHLKERASEKALRIRNWMLNPAIEIV